MCRCACVRACVCVYGDGVISFHSFTVHIQSTQRNDRHDDDVVRERLNSPSKKSIASIVVCAVLS